MVDSVQTADKDDEIATLKKGMADRDTQLAQERTARQAAEKAAGEATSRAEASVSARVAADRQTFTTAIGAAETELEALQSAQAAAMADSKWEDVAKLNTQIADATLRRSTSVTQLSRLESWAKRETERVAAEETRRTTEQRQPGGGQSGSGQPTWDQVLQQNIMPSLTDADREFLARTGLASTPQKWRRTQGYHEEALEAGVKQFTPEYYDYIESRFGGGVKNEGGAVVDPISEAGGSTVVNLAKKEGEQVVKPTAQATGLAPTRGNGSGGTSRRGNEDEVVLNASEQEQAIRSFPKDFATGKPLSREESFVAFAQQKKRLIAEGRIPA